MCRSAAGERIPLLGSGEVEQSCLHRAVRTEPRPSGGVRLGRLDLDAGTALELSDDRGVGPWAQSHVGQFRLDPRLLCPSARGEEEGRSQSETWPEEFQGEAGENQGPCHRFFPGDARRDAQALRERSGRRRPARSPAQGGQSKKLTWPESRAYSAPTTWSRPASTSRSRISEPCRSWLAEAKMLARTASRKISPMRTTEVLSDPT